MFAPIVLVSTPIVTLSPAAFVVIPFSPTILNLIPPVLSSCCVAVTEALSPPNWIVFVANLVNWDTFTASVPTTPGATFVILFPPALIPFESITVSFPPVPGTVNFLLVTESKPVKSLFNL